jgi:hypothetical protein
MRSRRRALITAVLLVALVVSTILAASAMNSINTSLPQPVRVLPQPPATPQDGVLFVRILIGIRPQSPAPLYGVMYFKDLAAEPATITRTDQPLFTLRAMTNITGLIILNLPPSKSYVFQINESRFEVTIPFSIVSGRQTTVLMTIERLSYLTQFAEGQDAHSVGWITPGSRIFLNIVSGQALPLNNHPYYLETESASGLSRTYDNLTRDITMNEVPLSIFAQDLRPGGLWLGVSPTMPISIAGVTSISIVRYIPRYNISIAGSS